MAVVDFSGGQTLASVGDTASAVVGEIVVTKIIIVKTDAGTVSFKDGAGVAFLTTSSLGDGSMTQLDFGAGFRTTGVEYDAVGAGSAVITVFHSGRRVAR